MTNGYDRISKEYDDIVGKLKNKHRSLEYTFFFLVSGEGSLSVVVPFESYQPLRLDSGVDGVSKS